MPAPAQCGAVQRSERTLPCPAHPQRRTRQALGASGWTRFTGSSRAASISGLCRRLAAGASAPVRMPMHRALPDARHDICGHLRADRPRALAATIDGLHRRPIQVRDHSSSLVPATLCRRRAGDPPRERFSTSPRPIRSGARHRVAALGRTCMAAVAKRNALPAVQQPVRLRHVRHVRRRALHVVHQPPASSAPICAFVPNNHGLPFFV